MEVPHALRPRLLATFNSGFKLQDAGGGWADGAHVRAASARPGDVRAATPMGASTSSSWHGGPDIPRGVDFARQNLPLIVEGGRPNPNLNDGPEWGATLGNAIRVWRSGSASTPTAT